MLSSPSTGNTGLQRGAAVNKRNQFTIRTTDRRTRTSPERKLSSDWLVLLQRSSSDWSVRSLLVTGLGEGKVLEDTPLKLRDKQEVEEGT